MILNQVTLRSRDVARGAAFYRLLGFVQIVEALPHYARFEIPDGLATLSLELFENSPTGPRAVVYFECADVDATVEALQAHGATFQGRAKVGRSRRGLSSWESYGLILRV